MITADLNNIKDQYSEYRTLLFNDDIPEANKITFKLHSLPFAAGYSMYNEKSAKNKHIIAFCKLYKFSEKEINQILIHEMIHLWQTSHVKLDRYKVCSNDIAHDRVFRTKMNTINLILKKNMINLHIDEVCNYKLELDHRVHSKKMYDIIIFKYNSVPCIIKTTEYYKNKIISSLTSNENITDICNFKSNDVDFMQYKTSRSLSDDITSLDKDFYNKLKETYGERK